MSSSQSPVPLRLRPYRSSRFVVHARLHGIDYKLFQVIYGGKDGAIFVNLANYFKQTQGIAAHVLLPASGGAPVTFDLAGEPQRARLTNTLVKYSHHANGYAHFSQRGKLDRAKQIHKQAVPLSAVRGHLFTLHIKGFADFTRTTVDPSKVSPQDAAERNPIVFSFGDSDPGEVKFIGGWASTDQLCWDYAWSANDGVVGPLITKPGLDGKSIPRVLLAPPKGTPLADSALVLHAAPVPYELKEAGSRVLFIGGFDPPAVALDPEKDSTMLVLKYPCTDWDNLQGTIECMDLRQDG